MAEAMSRTPIRRDSFERSNNCFPMLDATPRRFSTGAPALPMPTPQVLLSQASAELELEERNGGSRARTPKDHTEINTAMRFQMNSYTPSIARLAALTTPCYFHKRFGDAVDIDKVLEEVRGMTSLVIVGLCRRRRV